jgi:hypothetical protein
MTPRSMARETSGSRREPLADTVSAVAALSPSDDDNNDNNHHVAQTSDESIGEHEQRILQRHMIQLMGRPYLAPSSGI